MSKAFYSWRLFCCNVCVFCHNCYNSVMLWLVDSALALKCKIYELESWLAGHLKKGSVCCRGRPSL